MPNPYPMIKSPCGFLRPFKEHKGIYVDFSYQTHCLRHEDRCEIIDYFWEQGFAEAHPLPYEVMPNGLVVTRDVLGFYQKSVSVEYDPLPF